MGIVVRTAEESDVAAPQVGAIEEQTPRRPSLLESFRLAPDQHRFVYEVWQAAIQQCMNAQGFEYFVAPFAVVDAAPRLPTSIEEVLTHGYNPIAQPLPSAAQETINAVESDPAYRQAFVGDEQDLTDGCRDQALQRAIPPDGEYQRADAGIEAARSDIQLQIEALPEYHALDDAWATCMGEHGYDYRQPSDALSEPVGQPVDREQIDTRIADLNCQADVSYEATIGDLELRLTQRWVDENQAVVAEIARAKERYLAELLGFVEEANLSVAPAAGLTGASSLLDRVAGPHRDLART